MRGLLGAHVTWVSTLLCVQLALTSSPCPTGDRWSDPPASLATWPVGAGGGLQVTWTRPPRASLPITWYQVWARGDHGVGVNATAPQNDSEQLSVELSGLEPNTTYYIEVCSTTRYTLPLHPPASNSRRTGFPGVRGWRLCRPGSRSLRQRYYPAHCARRITGSPQLQHNLPVG